MAYSERLKKHFSNPNVLTMYRVFAIPGLVVLLLFPNRFTAFFAALIFSIASITDALDGFFARRLGLESSFGKVMDPVADKLLVSSAFIMMTSLGWVPAWIVCVIIGREITISALREWMAGIGERGKVAVIDVAKYKTLAQMFGVAFMLHGKGNLLFGIPVYEFGLWLLVIAAGLTLWSMFVYLKDAWPKFTAEG